MPEPVIRELELVSLLKRVVNLHNHSGEISLTPELREIHIHGDDQLLSRIFSNLIINGFQAARPGVSAKVSISVMTVDHHVRIIVKDNGKGIKPEFLESVFTPHFSTKKSGSGLGLAISKQGIEQMNGKIWFESQVGSGTTFYIELPLRRKK
jgi:signal transduction histidine kinase